MDKTCENCRYENFSFDEEPCQTCIRVYKHMENYNKTHRSLWEAKLKKMKNLLPEEMKRPEPPPLPPTLPEKKCKTCGYYDCSPFNMPCRECIRMTLKDEKADHPLHSLNDVKNNIEKNCKTCKFEDYGSCSLLCLDCRVESNKGRLFPSWQSKETMDYSIVWKIKNEYDLDFKTYDYRLKIIDDVLCIVDYGIREGKEK